MSLTDDDKTRNFTATWSFRPPEILDFKGFSKSKIEYFSVFSPAFLPKSFLNEFLLVGKTD